MKYRAKWGPGGGWLDDKAWINLFGNTGPFDAKVLATVAWAAIDHIDEEWGDDQLADHCTYELDCSADEIKTALHRLVERKALTPNVLMDYDDECVALEEVFISVETYLLQDAELSLVHAVGLQQAYADHVALLQIFELRPSVVKARFGPEQDPGMISVDSSSGNEEWGENKDSNRGVSKKIPRVTSRAELDDLVVCWESLQRGTAYHDEESLIRFLGIFTPAQIKGAMRFAKSKRRPAYFKYLCGILHNWRRELEAGVVPTFFSID